LNADHAELFELAARLPDIPRWVEARGFLLSGRCEVLKGRAENDLVVRGLDRPLLCVVGRPDATALTEAVLCAPADAEVLAPPESVEEVARALPDWSQEGAAIHALSREKAEAMPAGSVSVGLLSRKKPCPLDHVPAPLRKEIEEALNWSSHVAAAFDAGVPVSFCYCASETETLWDVSIDTLEPYRRRGIAAECAGFLIHHMSTHGKAPVWGALDSNLASAHLASKLGFSPVDRMQLFTREPGGAR